MRSWRIRLLLAAVLVMSLTGQRVPPLELEDSATRSPLGSGRRPRSAPRSSRSSTGWPGCNDAPPRVPDDASPLDERLDDLVLAPSAVSVAAYLGDLGTARIERGAGRPTREGTRRPGCFRSPFASSRPLTSGRAASTTRGSTRPRGSGSASRRATRTSHSSTTPSWPSWRPSRRGANVPRRSARGAARGDRLEQPGRDRLGEPGARASRASSVARRRPTASRPCGSRPGPPTKARRRGGRRRSGTPRRATGMAESLPRRPRAVNEPHPRALVAPPRGTLPRPARHGPEAERRFEEALALHQATTSAFDRARTPAPVRGVPSPRPPPRRCSPAPARGSRDLRGASTPPCGRSVRATSSGRPARSCGGVIPKRSGS